MSDDLERDAQLLAALRHAPDRDATPPPALTDRILAQARAQARARKAMAPSGPGWVQRWFGWMARPMAAAALGSVSIAGVVGMMWHAGPPSDNLSGADRAEPRVATSGAPPAAPAPAAPPPEAQPPAAPPPEPAAAVPRGHSPRAARPAPEPERRALASESAIAHSSAELAKSREQLQASAQPDVATPPVPRDPPAKSQAVQRDRAAGPAAAVAVTAAAGAAAFDPLVPALLSLTGESDRVLRQRLQGLQARIAGPWVETPAPATGWGEEIVDAGGQRLGRLLVQPALVTWQGRDGLTWQAPLLAASSSR